jgi:hypothetical protein
MEISLKRNYGFYLIFKAENVSVEEDVEERIYSRTEDGKIDFSKPTERDINDDVLNQITNLLSELIYYRKREFDSSSLIEGLFEQLPAESVSKLLVKFNKDYEII